MRKLRKTISRLIAAFIISIIVAGNGYAARRDAARVVLTDSEDETTADLNKETMYQDVYEGLLNAKGEDYITTEYYPISEYSEKWATELEVEYCYSFRACNWMFWSSDGGKTARIEAKGLPDPEGTRQKEQAFLSEVECLAAQAAGRSTEEKIRFFHDTLINRCEYDTSNSKTTAYDCMIGGSAVCRGYVCAFYHLCKASGLTCEYVSGSSNQSRESGSHAWNRVKLDDGTWTYIDVTWDDTGRTDKYLMVSEEEMNRDHFPETYLGAY